MATIADIFLAGGALGAAFYCYVLSRRLSRFNNLKDGMGGAVAVLSAQVDEMTSALSQARTAAENSSGSLGALTDRAEHVARRLELLVAAMHDLPASDGANASRVHPRPAGGAANDVGDAAAASGHDIGTGSETAIVWHHREVRE